MSRLLTVFGATGQQGGSLINHVLNHPELSRIYHLRGVTRDVSKQSALALQAKGVEIVQADLSDPASLVSAVSGSYVVFGVTNFWDKTSLNATIEVAQGKAIADASVNAGVTLLIWSSLPNVTKMTEGKVTNMHHFDSKAEVETYIRRLPIISAFFVAGWYMQNHIYFLPPVKMEDGTAIFYKTWKPDTLIPMIDITDTGKYITPILLDPRKYNGKSFTCATGFYTPIQLVEGWIKVTGTKVIYEQVDPEKKQGALTEEMHNALKGLGGMNIWGYFGASGVDDLKWTLDQMEENPNTWEEFLVANSPWLGRA